MRLAIVSTYPPARCGIGNYSHELVEALTRAAPEIEVTVLSEPDVWSRTGDWVTDIAAAVERLGPDVVHVQHEESMFGQDSRLVALLGRLGARGIGTVVTMHTVHPGRSAARFHRALAGACDRVILHQQTGMASELIRHGVQRDQLDVIAHGTPTLDLPDRVAARRHLDLPVDAEIALFFGFIHFRKRVHVALEAFTRVARTRPNARLVIVGQIRRSSVIDGPYEWWLRRRLRTANTAGQVVFRPGFVPAADKASYYAAADFIVLPHRQPYGSASGVLHEALAAERAILCARSKKFAEAAESLAPQFPSAFPDAADIKAWERGFVELLDSSAFRADLARGTQVLARRTSWSASASEHARVYRSVARGALSAAG